MKSFLFEPMAFLIRVIMRTMVQSFFQHYSFQITALVISDVISIIIVVVFRQ
jgi:hypothetical protein